MEFKDRLKKLRLEKGLTQTALAYHFGKSESAVRMWETERARPDIDTLIELAKFFDCSTDYLLGLNDYTNLNEKENTEKAYNDVFLSLDDAEEYERKAIIYTFKILNIGRPSFYFSSKSGNYNNARFNALNVAYIKAIVGIASNLSEMCTSTQQVFTEDDLKRMDEHQRIEVARAAVKVLNLNMANISIMTNKFRESCVNEIESISDDYKNLDYNFNTPSYFDLLNNMFEETKAETEGDH